MKFGKLQQNWKKIARINFKNERKVLRNWNQRLGETFFLDLCIHSDTFLQSCLGMFQTLIFMFGFVLCFSIFQSHNCSCSWTVVHEGTLFCGYSDGNVNVWDLDSCSFITTLKPPQNFPFPPPPPPHQNAPEGLIDLWDDVEAAVAFTTSPYDCISFMDISGNLFATSNWNNNIHIFNLNQIQSPIVLTAPTPHVMVLIGFLFSHY
jgi:WD40 repeat protein